MKSTSALTLMVVMGIKYFIKAGTEMVAFLRIRHALGCYIDMSI